MLLATAGEECAPPRLECAVRSLGSTAAYQPGGWTPRPRAASSTTGTPPRWCGSPSASGRQCTHGAPEKCQRISPVHTHRLLLSVIESKAARCAGAVVQASVHVPSGPGVHRYGCAQVHQRSALPAHPQRHAGDSLPLPRGLRRAQRSAARGALLFHLAAMAAGAECGAAGTTRCVRGPISA